MNEIITVEGLHKNYGSIQAVKGIDFYVESGKLFAFLGPNGAGKSTTIDILCTLLPPDSGRVLIDGMLIGKEDAGIRGKIGVVFQDSVLDPLLTVQENLMTRGKFYGLTGAALREAVQRAACTSDVLPFLHRPYGKLSGGQRRRADIARALVNTPSILFLDEPTTGLDPKAKEGVWNMITSLQKATGMTVFLTTHYMEEAATADYIILLNDGKIAAKGTPTFLKEKYSADTLRMKPSDTERVKRQLEQAGLPCMEKNGLLITTLPDTMAAIPLLHTLREYLESFEVVHGSMEDAYLNITGGTLQNA